ncbi:hypothetical protein [Ekhidna sp.]
MKQLTLTAVLLTALLSGNMCFAQSSNLHGTWTIDFDETLDLVTSGRMVQYDTLSEEGQSQLQTQLLDQRFIFNPDSTFLMGTNGAQYYDGRWVIESNQLKLTFNQGANLEYPMEFVNATEVKLTVVADPNSNALFHQYLLKKSPSN